MQRALVTVLFVVSSCSETVELGSEREPATCEPGGAQCNDCEDNDNDGRIDGFDPECTGALDDDEASFATGIPGDNQNRVRQDCAFDGNSGGGNDGCDVHVCCILELMGMPCPSDLQPQAYDPSMCAPSSACIENCAPLVPAGCDCFGCCTVCVGQSCDDIFINTVHSPGCTTAQFDDADICTRCVKSPTCGSSCDPSSCVLCPGQEASDLPAGCTLTCPANSALCSPSTPCSAGEFCSNGCCIGIPE